MFDVGPDEIERRQQLTQQLEDLLNPSGDLESFCSFGPDGQVLGGEYDDAALDIGMGIRPDLVGQGNGRKYAEAVIAYGVAQYSAQQLRVTIAQFNQRAQRVWARLGFEAIETFTKTSSQERFVIMMRAEA